MSTKPKMPIVIPRKVVSKASIQESSVTPTAIMPTGITPTAIMPTAITPTAIMPTAVPDVPAIQASIPTITTPIVAPVPTITTVVPVSTTDDVVTKTPDDIRAIYQKALSDYSFFERMPYSQTAHDYGKEAFPIEFMALFGSFYLHIEAMGKGMKPEKKTKEELLKMRCVRDMEMKDLARIFLSINEDFEIFKKSASFSAKASCDLTLVTENQLQNLHTLLICMKNNRKNRDEALKLKQQKDAQILAERQKKEQEERAIRQSAAEQAHQSHKERIASLPTEIPLDPRREALYRFISRKWDPCSVERGDHPLEAYELLDDVVDEEIDTFTYTVDYLVEKGNREKIRDLTPEELSYYEYTRKLVEEKQIRFMDEEEMSYRTADSFIFTKDGKLLFKCGR